MVIDQNDFYSVQKTPNNLYVLAGDATSPYASYKKDNSGSWNALAGGTGLYMINDGMGYSLDAGILTNGGENIMTLLTIENDMGVSDNTIFRSWTYCIDINHSDISIVNDTMIYALSGKVLLKSSPGITDNVKEISQNRNSLTIKNNLDGNLIFKTDYPFVGYEIMDISGNIIYSINLHLEIKEAKVNVFNIPAGIYLIKVIFSDKRTEIYKWIKY